MLADYLIHLEHHRVGRRVALQVYVCGRPLQRMPALVATIVARLFKVPVGALAEPTLRDTRPV